MRLLDRRYGPFSGRVWGLIVNFLANASALYGALGYLRDGSRFGYLSLGLIVTVGCILTLSVPSAATLDPTHTAQRGADAGGEPREGA